jgi:hypothetical protein
MRLVAERTNRVVAMADGQVVFDGMPTDLLSNTQLLHKAHLRPPPITRVGQRLGLPTPLLRIYDVVQALRPNKAVAW